MSRIGKKPVAIPSGVEVTVNDSIITVKKGAKSIDVETHGRVGIEVAENNVNLAADSLVIREAIVEEGPALRRFRPCARGSAHPYKKRMSHFRIVLSDNA